MTTLTATPLSADVSELLPVANVADLRLLAAPSNQAQITVQGGSTAGDGNGGEFWYDATSSVTDDGVDYVKPSAVTGAGRWRRIRNLALVELGSQAANTVVGNSTGSAATPTATKVTNAMVDPAAAIAYSKLSLTGSIVNADVSASAALALSKLAAQSAYSLVGNNTSGSAVPTAVSNDALLVKASGSTAERSLGERFRDCVNALDEGADNTGVASSTSAFSTALTKAVAAGKALYIPAGTYLGVLSVRNSNVTILGDGSAVTTIRHPVTTLTNVLELGDTASGNAAAAYSNITVCGLTLDGNRANLSAPTSDLVGHGLPLTKISNFHISDVRAINCYNAGFLAAIDSNYGYADCYVENCGNATYTAPGFDINSSKYGEFFFVSKGCQQGGRVLDNCYGLLVRGVVQNATAVGFSYGNQTINESYGNDIEVAVIGSGNDGVQIGNNCRDSNIRVSVEAAAGNGIQEVYYATASQRPASNRYSVVTKSCQQSSAIIGGDGGTWDVVSYLDGLQGAAGSHYAVQVSGSRNIYSANVTDGGTPQIRGITLAATAASNKLLAFSRNTLVSDYSDSGSGNLWFGEAAASWTPTDKSGAGLTFTIEGTPKYTRSGNQVIASFAILYPATVDASAASISLPIVSASVTASMSAVSFSYTDYGNPITGAVVTGSDSVIFYTFAGVAITNANLSGKRIRGTAMFTIA